VKEKQIYLIGIGMGTEGTLTEKARELINKSQILIGAKRMLEPFAKEGKELFYSYKADEIKAYLCQKETFQSACVLLSGDVGFYSGSKKLLEVLGDFEVELIPGITSMVYFCSRLRTSWEDVCFGSAHGKTINVIQRIQRYKKCFFLLDGEVSLKRLCEKLRYYGMEGVTLHVGENLSYEDERIVTGKPEDFETMAFGTLLVVLIENVSAKNWVASSIPDEAFIRTKVPMTKSEVRTISIGKLQLEADSVVYDVGGGSGSVSVEMAMQSPDIKVYSVEKKPEALELMEQNKRKFAADNIEIIEGNAPEALEKLPAPTHAFIGGSSGNLDRIVDCIFEKNPMCRIVINTIALNSMAQVMELFKSHPEYESDIVQIQASNAKQAAGYQMMMGQNPIYIITLWRKTQEARG
jgi:precorrin-6Y C5,15-methyltransferase (decarboxylating)